MSQPNAPVAAERTRRSFPARFVAAFRLDPGLYDEIEHDPGAFGQAALLVALGGLSRGIASVDETGIAGLALGLGSGLAIWVAASFVVHVVGVRWFGYSSDFRELLRTLGFAASPLLLLALCALPLGGFAGLLSVAAHAMATLAFFIAVRQALDVDTGRALIVCVLAIAVGLLLLFVIGLIFLATPTAQLAGLAIVTSPTCRSLASVQRPQSFALQDIRPKPGRSPRAALRVEPLRTRHARVAMSRKRQRPDRSRGA
jgi:hypothetical protein